MYQDYTHPLTYAPIYTHPLTYAPRLYTPSYVCTKIIHTHLRMHQDYTHPLIRMHQDYTHPLTYMHQDNTPSYICINTTTLLRMRQYNTYPSPYICIKMTYTLLRMHRQHIPRRHTPFYVCSKTNTYPSPPHNNVY